MNQLRYIQRPALLNNMEANLTTTISMMRTDPLIYIFSIIAQQMGGEQSKLKAEVLQRINDHPYRKEKAVAEEQFVNELFRGLDLTKMNAPVGPTFISGTHVLKLYYDRLQDIYRGPFSKNKTLKNIQDLYSQPQKAIEESFKIIQSNSSSTHIPKEQFIDFVMACFDKGMSSILKHSSTPGEFKVCFQEWIYRNRHTIIAHAEKIFQDHTQSNDSFWTEGDFKRWILSQHQWSLYVELKGVSYNIPLNLLSLFGINLENK